MTPRFDLIGIVTDDIARSVDFYRRLGVEVDDPTDAPHVEGRLPGGPRLAWDRPDVIASFDPSFALPDQTSGRIGLAFRCDDPAEVDATYGAMIEAGYEGHLPPWDAFWGMRYASLHDPDGHGVDLFADLPGRVGDAS